jgi:AcrR family transcriptional regulator
MQDTLEEWLEELLKQDADGEKMTEKQSKIVQAAIEVFAEKGYAASSTSEIAQRAGVAEGTIFRHYKTKKDLLLSIVAPTMVKLLAPFVLKGFNNVLDSEYESLDQFLRAMIDNRLEFMKKHKNILKIVIQEVPFHLELQEQFKKVVLARVLDRIRGVIDKLKAKGKVVDLPTDTIIRLCASSIGGYLLVRMVYGETEGAVWDDQREREETIAYVMRGLGIN